jgi:acetyl-CoA C-acetyltransferase
VSDGAAGLILTHDDVAKTLPRAVRIRGRGHAGDHLAVATRPDPLALEGGKRAFNQALAEAGVQLEDLDLLEAHDCFTIAELLEMEAFGLAAPGEAAQLVASGATQRDGRLPVNVSGGLKAKGHPIGATGVSQHVMAAMQLAGEAGEMQLDSPERAAVFNMGGAGVANYATVLERSR